MSEMKTNKSSSTSSFKVKMKTHKAFFSTWVLGSADVVKFLFENLLDRFFFLKCYEDKSSPFIRLWVHWKLNGLDLRQHKLIKTQNC